MNAGKFFGILVAVGWLCAQAVHADIVIQWFASMGFYVNGSGPNPAEPEDFTGYVFGLTSAQLIWSPDPIPSIADPHTPSYLTEGEVLLNTLTTTSVWGDFNGDVNPHYYDSDFLSLTGGIALDEGFVYSRVFGGAELLAGDYYHASHVIDAVAWTTANPVPPQLLDHNHGMYPGYELNTLAGQTPGLIIVPEPSVSAFCLLGAFAILLRRKMV